jgi:hypothetical protein
VRRVALQRLARSGVAFQERAAARRCWPVSGPAKGGALHDRLPVLACEAPKQVVQARGKPLAERILGRRDLAARRAVTGPEGGTAECAAGQCQPTGFSRIGCIALIVMWESGGPDASRHVL